MSPEFDGRNGLCGDQSMLPLLTPPSQCFHTTHLSGSPAKTLNPPGTNIQKNTREMRNMTDR